MHLIEVLLHLRDTGMPLTQIAQFTRYVAADPDCVHERLALLQQHRERVLAQLRQLNDSLTVIEQKITDYVLRLNHTSTHSSAGTSREVNGSITNAGHSADQSATT